MPRPLTFAALATALMGTTLPAQGPSAADRAVTINFRATVGRQPFVCGTKYPGLGRTGAEAWATEFRFFVHDVVLFRADGSAEPVTLEQDGRWQAGGIALLDFEHGEGPCSNGTPEERHMMTGTVPAGDYTGVRFTVGVPFEQNHLELATQPSPLNLSRMFWSWSTGYKFMRVDLRAQRPDTAATVPWMIHLGSTGCSPTGAGVSPSRCVQENRAVIALDTFDPARDAIVLDLAALVADADLLTNQERTAAGCMSGTTDLDCAPIFAALGLGHGETRAPKGQRAFRVERATQP
jgi:uncharacterized repeat protein (TIGR04052 family)